jgi:hypothetical protein
MMSMNLWTRVLSTRSSSTGKGTAAIKRAGTTKRRSTGTRKKISTRGSIGTRTSTDTRRGKGMEKKLRGALQPWRACLFKQGE